MPRQSKGGTFRSERLTDPTPRGLIASARNYTKDPIKATNRLNRVQNESWQKLAWEFFDSITEYHYSVTVVANLLSRAKLIVTKDGKPTTDAVAVDLLDALGGGPEGQTELLRQYGIHFTVAGDSYLIGMEREDGDQWFVAAASEISEHDGIWKVGEETLLAGDLVIRAWRAHPQKRALPDAPTRAALPVLEEIDGLSKHVKAQTRSRLAGAGILFIPEEMNIGAPPTPIVPTGDIPDVETPPVVATNSASELVSTLIETMGMALEDQGSASSLVPIVVQVKGDTIEHVKLQTFWTDLDEHANPMRVAAIQRLALGMDMPPEMLQGVSDSNHWAAWQADESAIKAHAEPLLFAITAALTDGYLRALMLADKMPLDEANRYAIGADTSEMRLRPNRSQEAIELYDRGVLSPRVVVRENGFNEDTDVMTDDERAIWLLLKTALGSPTPQMMAEALMAFKVPGITMEAAIPERITVTDDTKDPKSTTPSLEGHPTSGPPDPDESEAVAATLVGPGFAMVDRALERAGNRIRSTMQGKVKTPGGREVSAADTYRYVSLDFSAGLLDKLLEDAWGHCDRFASEFGVDGPWLRNALDTYTRDLLQFGRANSAVALKHHLALTSRTHPERVTK